ncbi:MAG: glycoside hydrolase family 127 protein, partial [Verrucomicrobia bacterium]|nr:glycoside hydrolase family 127 protein [Verrucomicrobiota bacterium]
MSAKKLAFFAVGLAAAGQLARADFVEHSRQPAKAPPSAPPKARPFRFDQVRLLPGVFLDSQEAALRYLKSLEPDRLLAGFRKEAGLAPKAEPYGGWERTQLAGHSLGHYLSAISLAYAATEDAAFRRRAEYIVKELAACQKAFGDGYVAAIPKGRSLLGKLAEGKIDSAPFRLNGLWSPLYVLHKEMAGLRDAWRLCGVASALDVEKGLADWIDRTLAPLSPEQMERVLACEYGGMNEVLADLY